MPYLEEWSTLEDDYSSSMSGATNALLSSSIRLPVSGEVRVRFFCLPSILCFVLPWARNSYIYSGSCNNFLFSSQADVGQLEEALTSASKVVESIASHIQRYIHKVPYTVSLLQTGFVFYVFA